MPRLRLGAATPECSQAQNRGWLNITAAAGSERNTRKRAGQTERKPLLDEMKAQVRERCVV